METPTGFYFRNVYVGNGVADDVLLYGDHQQKILVGGLEKLSDLDQVLTACANQGFKLERISAPPAVVRRLLAELVPLSGLGCVPRGCVGDVHNETCPKFKGGAALALLGAADRDVRCLTNEVLVMELERRRVTFDYGDAWMAERVPNCNMMLFTKDLSKGQGIRFRVPFELLAALNIAPKLDELERQLEVMRAERDSLRARIEGGYLPTIARLQRLEAGRPEVAQHTENPSAGIKNWPVSSTEPIAHLDVDLLCDDE